MVLGLAPNPLRHFGVGWIPVALAIGDLNEDGRPDLAVVNNLSPTVSILINESQ